MLVVKLQHFEIFRFDFLKVLVVEKINTVNTKKIKYRSSKWMMFRKMSLYF